MGIKTTRYKVLVVDDDATINEMLNTYLNRNGYDVSSAYSGTEAVLLMKTQIFDLVILDLMLPGLSGEQVLEKMKEIRQIPVIGLSAKDDAKSKMEHPQQVFTKDMIYEKLWNESLEGTENAINVHISNIRKKLSAIDNSKQYIKTVWGIGFKLEI